jgi:integrase
MTRRRIRVASGIYRDQYGLAAIAAAGTGRAKRQREQRFPGDSDLELLKRWQVQARAELQGEQDDAATIDEPVPERGTFAKDLPRYLKLIEGQPRFKSDRSHLRAWLPLIGHLKRTAIRTSHVRAAFATWQTEGKSARTIRHRRRVLRELYQALDGAHARPPIKGVKVPKPDDPHPTPTPVATIQRVAKSLRQGLTIRQACGPTRKVVVVHRAESPQTYARFLVRATTGQRPSQITRATPSDVDERVRRIWFVRPGKGGTPIPLPLNDDMVRAWRIFRWVKAWGPFDTRSFSKTIRRHGWPADTRPNNLRHTFAIDHLLAGTSLGEVQGLLGHKQIETTRRSYAPVQIALLKKAVSARRLKLA